MYNFLPVFLEIILFLSHQYFLASSLFTPLLVIEHFELDGNLAIMHLPFLFTDEEIEA